MKVVFHLNRTEQLAVSAASCPSSTMESETEIDTLADNNDDVESRIEEEEVDPPLFMKTIDSLVDLWGLPSVLIAVTVVDIFILSVIPGTFNNRDDGSLFTIALFGAVLIAMLIGMVGCGYRMFSSVDGKHLCQAFAFAFFAPVLFAVILSFWSGFFAIDVLFPCYSVLLPIFFMFALPRAVNLMVMKMRSLRRSSRNDLASDDVQFGQVDTCFSRCLRCIMVLMAVTWFGTVISLLEYLIRTDDSVMEAIMSILMSSIAIGSLYYHVHMFFKVHKIKARPTEMEMPLIIV